MLGLRACFTVTVLSAFMVCAFVFSAFAADEGAAVSAVARAEADVVSAHEAVLAAERLGGDVSGLLGRLSDAGERLAQAKVSFRLGDFDESVRLADLCSRISEEVKNEAEKLWLQAYGVRDFNLGVKITESLVSMVVVCLGGFWGWRVFKRRYYRRLLDMKPEVVSGES